MFHIALHRNKCWSGSSALVPQKIGSLILSPILHLCKGGFCCGCTLEELVCYDCALGGFAWPPPSVFGVLTRPPWLLPTEVLCSGGEVVYVLLSNNNACVFLSLSLNLLGVFALCLPWYCSVFSLFPLNLFPALVRLGSSYIPSMTYRSDLNCKTPLSHNNILIHKFKEFNNLPR